MLRTTLIISTIKKWKPISEMQSGHLLNTPQSLRTSHQICLSQSQWINGKEVFKSTAKTYLLVYIVRPEPGLSSLVRVTWQQWRFILPNLIDILHNHERLTNGFSVVDQDRDFLVNWVHLKKQRAFVPQVLLPIFIHETLLCQGNSDPHSKMASPEIQQDNLVCHCYYCEWCDWDSRRRAQEWIFWAFKQTSPSGLKLRIFLRGVWMLN